MYVNSCQEGITANKCFKNSYKFSLEYRFFLTWHLIPQINDKLSCACFYFNVDKKSPGFGECETATNEDSV